MTVTLYTVREIASMFDVNACTIHKYRKFRAIPPPVSHGRGARYTEEHVLAISALLAEREQGITLREFAAKSNDDDSPSARPPLTDKQYHRLIVSWNARSRRGQLDLIIECRDHGHDWDVAPAGFPVCRRCLTGRGQT